MERYAFDPPATISTFMEATMGYGAGLRSLTARAFGSKMQAAHPIAIGGVGGSGTRLIAGWLQRLGLFVGDDLNGALDNLWFTLLYKRRAILLDSKDDREILRNLFYRRMSGKGPAFTETEKTFIHSLAEPSRPQHSGEWLGIRAASLCAMSDVRPKRWGWKEPNTHIFAPDFLNADPGLRYLHLYRNGLEMAFSRNQNQAHLWGPIFLDDDAEASPARTLAYWCAAHRRMKRIQASFPDRVLLVRFEDLLADPETTLLEIASFAGLIADSQNLAAMCETIKPPVSGIEAGKALASFDPMDLAYLESQGYRTRLPV